MGSGSRPEIHRDPRRPLRFPAGCFLAVLICWISWIPSTVHSALPAGTFFFVIRLLISFVSPPSRVMQVYTLSSLLLFVNESLGDMLKWNSS